ncbi:hemerythrin domain-containing protein [Marinicella gelatinilytica]|uniref:hemerythrin domain-containing protein n=1 Tax=Marinicella gelatinilytica TaxID=2996017 RepID=UPI002260CF04|nr:hemerythrin domain-containing protein [Marinicella gelatinilytica]MCX7545054.1 hemerythrin domain-containing protein [Marinicella gelatinilytica]
MKIEKAIVLDHAIQRDLFKQLLDTSGDSDNRRQLFEQVKHELAIHADAEERYFYVPLIKIDATQDDARHGIAEHHEIEELVEKVEEADFDSSAWLKHAKNLAGKVLHHLDEEEQDYFPKADKVLSDEQASELGDQYLSAMKEARRNED